MRVAEDDQFQRRSASAGSDARRVATSPRPPSRAEYVRLACELSGRQSRREVRMQPAEGPNRQRVSEQASQQTISPVLVGTQPVAVLDVRAPTGQISPSHGPNW